MITKNLFTLSVRPSSSRNVDNYQRLKLLRTLLFASVFVTFGAVALAEGTPKKAEEPWIAPGRAARKENPVVTDPKSLTAGKELYTAGCLPCHGAAGKGDGAAAAILERNGIPIRPGNLSDPKLWQQSDGTIFWKISEGKNPMPAFQESFTEEQRWQIVTYVRTLAPKDEIKSQQPNNKGK